jgi:cyclic beta-1,2-glucan glucanotransferase
MEAVADRLVRPDDQLILLLAPPFDGKTSDPGYIRGYPAGIRENGGQYTHAAVWVVWAFAELGQGNRAAELFQLLNPIYHGNTPDRAMRYRVEPYVLAGDVYSVSPHVGRGGWTWYTGSTSWMYRVGLEEILGLRQTGNTLHIKPCIPKSWSGYHLTYRDGATLYEIAVENPDGVNRGVRQVSLDGKILRGEEILMARDGGHHKVDILMG